MGEAVRRSNRGAVVCTRDAETFYGSAREMFGAWERVELAVERAGRQADDPVLRFTDSAEAVLEVYGLNFGYDGGTPRSVLKLLATEGFCGQDVEGAVLNRAGTAVYPVTLGRVRS